MAKKTEPILTHTEILCFAIRHLENEIEDIKHKGENIAKRTGNKEMADGITNALIEPLTPKLEALKEMYRIETGTDYD